ncbi:carboxyltransferase domain-containing protein [Pseudactinotalea sp. HY158]|nr:carboxyltransferase domain-containing protein [Pseudactinotalea sp. HY158]
MRTHGPPGRGGPGRRAACHPGRPRRRAARARRRRPAHVVPAARTVLVTFAPGAGGVVRRLIGETLAGLDGDGAGAARAAGALVTIPVRYDGPDLAEVARRSGLTAAEVVSRHCAPTYVAEFIGFAPGFAYLGGLDPALRLPRLESPRTRVPAGAVGIAGDYTAVYPRPSPGGWLLLGTTTMTLFDLAEDPPTPLRAGARVRFEAIG